ncbi:MAG: Nre family DNA repair protein [Candidatus Diapherotrites archaeon]|nr:Nre family DNA repair protein [Candidatus Diapherotrites archaeon]
MIPKGLCLKCKGRLWCGEKCFVLEKFQTKQKVLKEIKEKEFVGSAPPGFFASWKNYPFITIAPLSPTITMRDSDLLDNPERWFGYGLEDLVHFRESLVQARTPVNAFEAANPNYDLVDLQEMAMSERQMDIEFQLQSAPKLELNFSDSVAPLGMVAELDDLQFQENPKINPKVEKFYYDSDAKSIDALKTLYSKGIPVHSLTKLLSAGIFGIGKQRKFVPTRWSITAVDSQISEVMVDRIKDFETIDYFELYHSNYLDNDFWVLLLPTKWQFEQLEAWKPGTAWTQSEEEATVIQDHEFYNGRTTYANNVAGAYYAARLAVGEHLMRRKRQAGALIFREIGEGYKIPVGVFQIRENVRDALKKKPLTFFELPLVLKFLEKKLSIPIPKYKKESKLLDNLLHQKRISEFF